MAQVIVFAVVLMVQVLTFFAAGRLEQTPAEGAPQLSDTVPVGVTPTPVHVVIEVTVVVCWGTVPSKTVVGVALEVMLSGVVPVTVTVLVPVAGA
jgi:hypothetical protein